MTFQLIFAVAWAVILGLGGGLLTKIGSWYRDLRKPSWQPPDWLFGPAWTVILGLAAWAFVLSWNGAPDDGARQLEHRVLGVGPHPAPRDRRGRAIHRRAVGLHHLAVRFHLQLLEIVG